MSRDRGKRRTVTRTVKGGGGRGRPCPSPQVVLTTKSSSPVTDGVKRNVGRKRMSRR